MRRYEFWGDTIQPITRVSQNELKSSQEGAREPGAERGCQPRWMALAPQSHSPASGSLEGPGLLRPRPRPSPPHSCSLEQQTARTVQLKAAEVAFSERTSQCPEHSDQEQGAWEHTSKPPNSQTPTAALVLGCQ